MNMSVIPKLKNTTLHRKSCKWIPSWYLPRYNHNIFKTTIMKKNNYKAIQYVVMSVMALILFSCSKDDKGSVEGDSVVSSADVKTVLKIDEVSSAADDIVRELFDKKTTVMTSKNNECYTATFTESGYSVVFANCSVKENGEKLSGSVTVLYGTENESLEYTANFDNLMVGDVLLNGTRSFRLSYGSDTMLSVQISSDMAITMANRNTISQIGDKTLSIVFNEGLTDGSVNLEGDWTMKTEGNTYTMTISKVLENAFDCDYVSKGILLLNKNGLEVSVDFGDGTCDPISELTYPDGTKENISLSK